MSQSVQSLNTMEQQQRSAHPLHRPQKLQVCPHCPTNLLYCSALLQSVPGDSGSAAAAVRHSAYVDPASARLSGLGSLADGV